jgi:hypothetical protein
MIGRRHDGVKNLTLSYIGAPGRGAMVLAPTRAIVQIRGMRWLPLLAVLASSASAGADPHASNPAFIGIRMNDLGIGCQVADVVTGGPAKDAGERPLDLILAVDGAPLAGAQGTGTCTVLLNRIISHAPGDTVRLDLRRGMDSVALKVTLSTRAEVLHRRFVGQVLPSATLADADDPRRSIELDDLRGHTTVIGWFHAETCVGCGAVFDRVRDAIRDRMHGEEDPPQLLAVTSDVKPGNAAALRKVFTSSVPLAVAPPDALLDPELLEPDRIHFLIIDARGIVRGVSPIAPDSDDLDAALDEVLAGVEQQDHATRSRR